MSTSPTTRNSTTSTSTTSITATEEDRALKAKHAAMWASGDYPAVAHDLVGALGGILVETLDVQPGQHVLDVAAGTGNVAIPAAEAGARVVASDLTPEFFEPGAPAGAGGRLEPSGSTPTPSGCRSRTSPSTW